MDIFLGILGGLMIVISILAFTYNGLQLGATEKARYFGYMMICLLTAILGAFVATGFEIFYRVYR